MSIRAKQLIVRLGNQERAKAICAEQAGFEVARDETRCTLGKV